MSNSIRNRRRSAEQVLSAGNNRLTLILSILIACCSAVAIVIAADCVLLAVGADDFRGWPANLLTGACVCGVYFAAAVYLIGPMTVGIYSTAARMCRGEYCNVADSFVCFSEMTVYDRAVAVSCRVTLKYGGFLLGAAVFSNPVVQICFILGGCALAALCVGRSGFCRELIFTDQPRRACAQSATDRMRGRKSDMRKLRLSYIPWILLGFATFGILLIADTVPYMFISNAMFTEISENNEGSVQNEQQT